MKWKKKVKIGFLALGLVTVLYFIVGGLIAFKAHQREESRHRKYQAQSEPQSRQQWQSAQGRKSWMVWTYKPSRQPRYEIHMYQDGTYLCAVWRYGTPTRGQPDRFVTGNVPKSFRKQLQSAIKHPDLQGWVNPKNDESDINLRVTDSDLGRRAYLYETARFEQLPAVMRKLDETLHLLVKDQEVKPPQAYTMTAVRLDYGSDDIPNLLRALESQREELHAHSVQQLVQIGDVTVPHLKLVLNEGESLGYRPVSRYLAVINGLAAFPSQADSMLLTMRQLAGLKTSVTSDQQLIKRAQAFIDEKVSQDYQDQQFKLAVNNIETAPTTDLDDEQRSAYELYISKVNRRMDHEVKEGHQGLIDMGSVILPRLIETLRYDRYERNRYNPHLIEVMFELGGADAVLNAIHTDVLEASACVSVLVAQGDEAVPTLLLLLDHEQRYAHTLIIKHLKQPEYARFQGEVVELLVRKLSAYGEASEPALQRIHRDASQALIALLMAWGSSDPSTVDVLVAAATDKKQHERVRLDAVHALTKIGSAAAPGAAKLKEAMGFETGRLYRDLETALKQICCN